MNGKFRILQGLFYTFCAETYLVPANVYKCMQSIILQLEAIKIDLSLQVQRARGLQDNNIVAVYRY